MVNPLIRAVRRLVCLVAALAVLAGVAAADSERWDLPRGEDTYEPKYEEYYAHEGRHWLFMPAVNGGYHQLIEGYDGYSDLGNAGLDLYIGRSPAPEEFTMEDRVMLRISADYFPLQVPEGTNGLEEDVYALTASAVVKMHSSLRSELRQWVPFLGFGAGMYWDYVTLDTPASGKVSGTHNIPGFNVSVGVMSPAAGILRLVPEVRFHALRTPGNNWAHSVAYQAALLFAFGAQP
jgi:hypothetical protein